MEHRHDYSSQQFQRLNQQKQNLKYKVKVLRKLLWIFIILSFISIGYLAYSEIKAPLFGKWPKIQQAKALLERNQQQLLVRLDSLEKANDILMENSPYYTGVFFEVQIGAFEHFDLSNYEESLTKFKVEYKEELQKYTLGKFRKLDMAESFRKDMEKLGIKDAFVVAKVEGVRTTIKEALEYQQKQALQL